MAARASIARHPIHAILVPFPIGLWVFSLVADIIYLSGWGPPVWSDVAFYTMAGGLIGALAAAVPGSIDFLYLKDPHAWSIAATHLGLNLVVVAIFAVDLGLRARGSDFRLPVTLSVIGVVLLGISGWLGGEMVYVHGVGVEPPHVTEEVRIQAEPRDQSRWA